MSQAIPAGIERISKTVVKQYALLLFLDGYPYIESTARKSADFTTKLNLWKRNCLPSLMRSDVRFFQLSPDASIKELPLIITQH